MLKYMGEQALGALVRGPGLGQIGGDVGFFAGLDLIVAEIASVCHRLDCILAYRFPGLLTHVLELCTGEQAREAKAARSGHLHLFD